MVRDRGELEARVMAALWQHDGPLTAREIQAAITDPAPAITTVLTVLERLRGKGRVVREEGAATILFSAAKTESEDAVEKMLLSLTATTDRNAALVRLAGNLDARDADTLRQALEARSSGSKRQPRS